MGEAVFVTFCATLLAYPIIEYPRGGGGLLTTAVGELDAARRWSSWRIEHILIFRLGCAWAYYVPGVCIRTALACYLLRFFLSA